MNTGNSFLLHTKGPHENLSANDALVKNLPNRMSGNTIYYPYSPLLQGEFDLHFLCSGTAAFVLTQNRLSVSFLV